MAEVEADGAPGVRETSGTATDSAAAWSLDATSSQPDPQQSPKKALTPRKFPKSWTPGWFEACERSGVLPEDLLERPAESFWEPGASGSPLCSTPDGRSGGRSDGDRVYGFFEQLIYYFSINSFSELIFNYCWWNFTWSKTF